MRTVWKFTVEGPYPEVDMPQGAEVLRFAMQGTVPCIWARVDTQAPMRRRYFAILGTGQEIGFEFNKYHGTCDDGPYVWHLFENTLP